MHAPRVLNRLSWAVAVAALAGLLAPTPASGQNRQGSGQSGTRAQAPSGRTATPRASAPRGSEERRGTPARQSSGDSSRARSESGERRGQRAAPPPAQARERGDRPSDGVAVPRDRRGPDRPPIVRIPRYRYYGYGYPYGYGYGAYHDPFLYDPFFWGFPGVGIGYPIGGYSMYGYGGGSYGRADRTLGDGGIRLKIKPRDAHVLVDGYYVGRVDDFDGIFQRLALDPGPHRIEIKAEGHQTLGFDVRIPIDGTITYRGELERITP